MTSPLRQTIETAKAETNLGVGELTVMARQTDPFLMDTGANHRDGQWLAETMATLGLHDRKIHVRGLHYAILGQVKPDGTRYINDDDHWTWLRTKPAKYARWLGYIPFDQITDQRNEEPVERVLEPHVAPRPWLSARVDVEIPDASEIEPMVGLGSFYSRQPYRIVMVGEKSSLDGALSPIAGLYGTDLYLPTGDLSDTMIYRMARVGATDGRPMVVLYFADADPAGWNMGIVLARKLPALKALYFPDLEFEVHRVALTPDQVREFELPSTPLKPSERRADKWRQAFGVDQTEIDALASLRPDLLRRLAREAITPFYDGSLNARVLRAQHEWESEAQAVVDNGIDQERLARIRSEFEAKLVELREEIDAINNALRIDITDFDLPPIPDVPTAVTQGLPPEPLLDSTWSFVEQTRRLRDSRNYGGAS